MRARKAAKQATTSPTPEARTDTKTAHELEALLDDFERQGRADRGKLDEMMHYAQSTACRARRIARYFAEPEGAACGRCDNCVEARGGGAAFAGCMH
jgi:superfamily II DNA helicase RecQ